MNQAGLYILGSAVVLVAFLTPVVMVVRWIFGIVLKPRGAKQSERPESYVP